MDTTYSFYRSLRSNGTAVMLSWALGALSCAPINTISHRSQDIKAKPSAGRSAMTNSKPVGLPDSPSADTGTSTVVFSDRPDATDTRRQLAPTEARNGDKRELVFHWDSGAASDRGSGGSAGPVAIALGAAVKLHLPSGLYSGAKSLGASVYDAAAAVTVTGVGLSLTAAGDRTVAAQCLRVGRARVLVETRALGGRVVDDSVSVECIAPTRLVLSGSPIDKAATKINTRVGWAGVNSLGAEQELLGDPLGLREGVQPRTLTFDVPESSEPTSKPQGAAALRVAVGASLAIEGLKVDRSLHVVRSVVEVNLSPDNTRVTCRKAGRFALTATTSAAGTTLTGSLDFECVQPTRFTATDHNVDAQYLAKGSVIQPQFAWYAGSDPDERPLMGQCPVTLAAKEPAIASAEGFIPTKALSSLRFQSCGLPATLKMRVLDKGKIRLKAAAASDRTIFTVSVVDAAGLPFAGLGPYKGACKYVSHLAGVATDRGSDRCWLIATRKPNPMMPQFVVADEVCVTIAGQSVCEKVVN